MLDGLNNAMTQAAAPQLGFAGLTQRHHLGSWPMDLTQMQVNAVPLPPHTPRSVVLRMQPW